MAIPPPDLLQPAIISPLQSCVCSLLHAPAHLRCALHTPSPSLSMTIRPAPIGAGMTPLGMQDRFREPIAPSTTWSRCIDFGLTAGILTATPSSALPLGQDTALPSAAVRVACHSSATSTFCRIFSCANGNECNLVLFPLPFIPRWACLANCDRQCSPAAVATAALEMRRRR